MGLLAIFVGLMILIGCAYRGWSILLLAPLAAMAAAFLSGEPVLAHWTQTFMPGAAGFIAQFLPIFLLGALFGKLMEESGSVSVIADYMSAKLGTQRALLAVILAGAIVTYGGVSLFVSFFVIAPMALALFRAANIPRYIIPAAIMLGTSTFTMSALPGTPAIQNTIPTATFNTTPFAAPGLGIIASIIMFVGGYLWLSWVEKRARAQQIGFDGPITGQTPIPHHDNQEKAVCEQGLTSDPLIREIMSMDGFDASEVVQKQEVISTPSILTACLPLFVVIIVNMLMSLVVLPRLDTDFLALPQWGGVSIQAVAGVWSVVIALTAAIMCLILLNFKRLPKIQNVIDSGLNAAALPILSVASLVGFGSVIAALPAFEVVRAWVLDIQGGPLVSLAVATNILAGLTGSASGGLNIALQTLGEAFLATDINPELLHRIASISAGTLDTLPHNGAVVTLLAVTGCTHKNSYLHIAISGILIPIIALVVVISLGSIWGSF